MSWRVEITNAALKDLKSIPRDILRKVDVRLRGLGEDPFPPQARKLSESDNIYRIRVGDYRVIYTVERKIVTVVVVRVRHRREAYRK